MNRLAYSLFILIVLLLAGSCTKQLDPLSLGAVKLSGIQPEIVNGAAATKAVDPLADPVGRESFVANDQLFFTKLCRTSDILDGFNYSDVRFKCSDKLSWSKTAPEDDIYWTDATSGHTFIGYSLPQVSDGKTFDWDSEDGKFYGTIGEKNATCTLSFEEVETSRISGAEATTLQAEDLLLVHRTDLVPSDAIAYVDVHHALSSMRVSVKISGFSTSASDNDHVARVKDLIVKNQPVRYVWDQTSYRAAAVPDGGSYRDMQLSLPHPEGTKEDKTDNVFVFYGLTAPHEDNELVMEFKVEYPDPMGEDGAKKVQSYRACISNVKFDAGYCTSIIINLSHENEDITVGVSYNDWIYVDIPDTGDLQKIQVFLKGSELSRVKLHNAPGLISDDAMWLYTAEGGAVMDIYGNDGSEKYPYLIKHADQFLALAYEVNKADFDFAGKFITLDSGIVLQPDNKGTSVTWPGIGDSTHPFNGTLLGGVRLVKRLKGKPLFGWIGPLGHVDQLLLEDVLEVDGPSAFVVRNDGIICASKVASVVGGSFELKSPLEISGLKKTETDNFDNIDWSAGKNAGTTTVAAPFVAYNNGIIMTCYCTGKFTSSAKRISGIVGYNNGAMVVDYAGVKGSSSYTPSFYRGTVAYNRYDPTFITNNVRPTQTGSSAGLSAVAKSQTVPTGTEYGALTHCFYDYQVAGVNPALSYGLVYGYTTAQMQSRSFIGSPDRSNVDTSTLNGNIHVYAGNSALIPKIIIEAYTEKYSGQMDAVLSQLRTHFMSRYYVFRAASYPWVY